MNWIQIITIISVLVILIFLGLAILLGYKAGRIKKAAIPPAKGEESREQIREAYLSQWQGVLQHIYSPSESDWKLAIIEADNLIDDILIRLGLPGETMADRLSSITSERLRSLEKLWEAHKMRNRIVHESDFNLTHLDSQRIISHYEEALKDLGVISLQ